MKLYITDINKIELSRISELDEKRAAKAARLKFNEDKKRCIAGGLFINEFLPKKRIFTDKHGKPFADGGKFFNISHSGDYVIFALSDFEVGCDIEKARAINALKIGRKVFCSEELNILKKSRETNETFFRLWTRKEALLKCVGTGFSGGFRALNASGDTSKINDQNYYLKTIKYRNCFISVCCAEKEIPDTPIRVTFK